MVRCSKVLIVQLILLVSVLSLMNFFFKNTPVAQKYEETSRFKFQQLFEDLTEDKKALRTTSAQDSSSTSATHVVNDNSQETKTGHVTEETSVGQEEEEEEVTEGEKKTEAQEEEQSDSDEDKTEVNNTLIEQNEGEELVKIDEEAKQEASEEERTKEKTAQVIKSRMERVRNVCERLNYPSFDQYNMYYFRQFGRSGVSWCPTFKASSSTWRDFFIDHVLGPNANFMGIHYHLGVLGNKILKRGSNRGSSPTRRRVFLVESAESVRFTVVRHPVSRLISFLRKAQNYPGEVRAQRGDWVEESILHSRTDNSWDTNTREKYRREWNTYIDEINTQKNSRYSEDNPYLHPPYPLFPELIDFIIRHRGADKLGTNGHWRPTIEWCDICQNDLNLIIQLEEEPEELMYLLEALQMADYKEHFLSRHNSSSDRSASREEIARYVQQLNQNQIDYLNNMYAEDFEMFGYDPISR